jgi:hypothetical protein
VRSASILTRDEGCKVGYYRKYFIRIVGERERLVAASPVMTKREPRLFFITGEAAGYQPLSLVPQS